MSSRDLRAVVLAAVADVWSRRVAERTEDSPDGHILAIADAATDAVIEDIAPSVVHGGEHCSCVIPCETCGATAVTGYLSGCEECSERRQCAYDRVEFGARP